MNKRKKILLALIAVLGCVYAGLLVSGSKNSVKNLVLKEKPDALVLEKNGQAVYVLVKEGDQWIVGEKKYPASASEAESLVKAIENIKVLETVSAEGNDDRFGMAAGAALVVKAKKNGAVIRTLKVGKAVPNSQQCYLTIDGAKAVQLVSGNLRQVFDKQPDALRELKIFSFKPEEVERVESSGKEKFALVKTGEPLKWSVADRKVPPAGFNAEKAAQWVAALTVLRAESFAGDTALNQATGPAASAPLATIRLKMGAKEASLTILKKTDQGHYLCVSSESPYSFYLPEYTATLYLKPLAQLCTP